jgi:hypothetical protein
VVKLLIAVYGVVTPCSLAGVTKVLEDLVVCIFSVEGTTAVFNVCPQLCRWM